MTSSEDIFYNIVNNFAIGEKVAFRESKSIKYVNGELKAAFCSGGKCYITMYLENQKKELTFLVNNNFEVIRITGLTHESPN